ncbi:MAG TPA: serine hydrolase domain-containing protein [Nitrososphaeraceae archaeon]|nr:serine hydrolase domain-containing protein [Nitrososphaeraceae archaeon]
MSVVLGVVSPNGTNVSSYGNISRANSTKVNANTIFDIGFITKTFTTTLLADMVKRGVVTLNDPLEKYLPSRVKVLTYHNNGHKITSGLLNIPERLYDNRTYPTQQVYNFISNSSLISEPGTRYNYSNLGMGLLGYVLSLKAGMPYAQLVKDRILNVLGMHSTGIAMNSTAITTPLPDLIKSRLAKGHMGGREINSFAFLPDHFIQHTLFNALYSTANDMLKYLAASMGLIQSKINNILQDTYSNRKALSMEDDINDESIWNFNICQTEIHPS